MSLCTIPEQPTTQTHSADRAFSFWIVQWSLWIKDTLEARVYVLYLEAVLDRELRVYTQLTLHVLLLKCWHRTVTYIFRRNLYNYMCFWLFLMQLQVLGEMYMRGSSQVFPLKWVITRKYVHNYENKPYHNNRQLDVLFYCTQRWLSSEAVESVPCQMTEI